MGMGIWYFDQKEATLEHVVNALYLHILQTALIRFLIIRPQEGPVLYPAFLESTLDWKFHPSLKTVSQRDFPISSTITLEIAPWKFLLFTNSSHHQAASSST